VHFIAFFSSFYLPLYFTTSVWLQIAILAAVKHYIKLYSIVSHCMCNHIMKRKQILLYWSVFFFALFVCYILCTYFPNNLFLITLFFLSRIYLTAASLYGTRGVKFMIKV